MKRKDSRTTEIKGVLAVREYCAEHNLIFQSTPEEDYGIDCYIEVCRDHTPLNFVVGLQVKSGPSYRRGPKGGSSFYVNVDEDHQHYWAASNIPVIFLYFDADERLWWKHVQPYVEEASQAALPRKILFTQNDLAGEDLANYLRLLQKRTPSAADRVRIAACKTLVIQTSHHEFVVPRCDDRDILPDAIASPDPLTWVKNLDLTIGRDARLDSDDDWRTVDNRVVGMSSDGQWIGYVRSLCDAGGVGYSYFHLLDRRTWCEYRFPIWKQEREAGPDEIHDSDEAKGIFAQIEQHVRGANLRPVYELRLETDLDSPDRTDFLGLEIGDIQFRLGVASERNRSLLQVRTDQFTPARKASVVAEIGYPARLMPLEKDEVWPDDHMGFETTKLYDHIDSLFISRCGKFITLMIGRNEENLCWGEVEYEFIHLTFEELRRICIDCISI